MLLIPALGRWKLEGVWMGEERNMGWEETGTQMQSEDVVRGYDCSFGLRIQ